MTTNPLMVGDSFELNGIIHYIPRNFLPLLNGEFIKSLDSIIKPNERLFVKYRDHPMLKNEWKEVMDDEKIDLFPGMVFVSEKYQVGR